MKASPAPRRKAFDTVSYVTEYADDMKDALALNLLPKEVTDPITGEVRTVPGHTSALNVKEFNDLIVGGSYEKMIERLRETVEAGKE